MTTRRITVTIPADLVDAADARAEELDRSRSWVVSEALRRSLPRSGFGRLAPSTVREPVLQAYDASSSAGVVDIADEIAASRRRRIRAELRLSPGERLRRAEELADLAKAAVPRAPRVQIVGFSSYEDYYEWKKAQLIR